MKDHEQYMGKGSPEVVFDILHSFEAEYFFLKRYIPKTKRAGDLFIGCKLIEIPKLPNLIDKIESISDTEKSLVAIYSQVFTKNTARHIPMMDFSNSIIKEYSTDRVKEIMEFLGQKSGVILNSGRCYHYYGFLPATHTEWINVMENGLKFNEIGPNYPRQQMIDGGCSLRLSTNSIRPQIPKVVDTLNI